MQAYVKFRESLSPEELAKHEEEMLKQLLGDRTMTAEEAAEADYWAFVADCNK